MKLYPSGYRSLVLMGALLLLSVLLSTAQEYGVFKGKVIDRTTGEALIGANIILRSDPTIGVASDLYGRFSLTVKAGTHSFLINYTGMKSDTITLQIAGGETIEKKIVLEPYISEIQGVEIKVGKYEKRYEDLTVSMEVIKSTMIESKNARSVKTALDLTPGLNILDGEAQIRGGSGFTFGVGSKVAVFVDDLPMLTGDAGRSLWDLIPVENIEQIEVIKGAASVLSGASSLSGAIYIRTAYPKAKPLTRVNAYSGFYTAPGDKSYKWWDDYPYITGLNFLHARRLGNLDLVAGGQVNFDHGYIGAPRPNPYVIDTVSDFTDKQMASRQYRMNFNLRYRSKKIQGLDYGMNGNIIQNNTQMTMAWLDDTSGFFRAYPGSAILQDMFSFFLDPFFNYYTQTGIRHSLKGRIFHLNNIMSNDQSTRQTVYIGDYQFRREYEFLDGFEFIGGFSGQFTNSHAKMYGGSGSPDNTLLNLSGYMQLEKNFFKTINLSLGIRLEHYSLNDTVDDTKGIFRLGGTLKLMQETYLRASFGQGYRYPTIAERFIRTSMGAIAVFENPDLKPESSWNAEIGLKQGLKFGNYFGYLDIAIFQQEYKNTIEYLFGFWDPTFTFAMAGFKFLNTGKTRITGIDISHTGIARIGTRMQVNTIVGYNYIIPKALEPDLVFAHDYNPGGGGYTEFSYNSTSVDPSREILKYRFLHTLKCDLEWHYLQWIVGYSVKYFSKIENLDKAIADFEQATISSGGTLQPILYMDYFEHHNNGNVVMDGRLSYHFGDQHKITLIVNNFLNRIYSLRPLKAEEIRSVILQYSLKL
ncbi:MAG: TonB-dependent receptor [Bacteroidales bacterium]|nr:TonB-dependent receptor [Lentimicrobiaceae bacterium]MDD5694197.1 TonB-dependent receptor [Bacteroidales bacterium]